jgi:preprotein translocase subunit SecG
MFCVKILNKGRDYMDTLLIIISLLLITIILLQSAKAESASQIISGGNLDLFSNRKERGGELFISRLTLFLGASFFLICLFMSFL